jgi:hypothetical protein
MKCANPDCDRGGRRIRGLCARCYMRQWTHGSFIDRKAYLLPERSPTMRDLGWAAGFLEGEGCFHHNSSKYRVPQIDAVQVNREPLTQLRSFLGGSVALRHGRVYQSDFWVWQVGGTRARGVMMTMYPMMSAKRQGQIRRALSLPHYEIAD